MYIARARVLEIICNAIGSDAERRWEKKEQQIELYQFVSAMAKRDILHGLDWPNPFWQQKQQQEQQQQKACIEVYIYM